MTHGSRRFRKFELLGRLHNYAGSVGRRGGSSTADLSTQSRLLALAIAPWAARAGILDRAPIYRRWAESLRRSGCRFVSVR